jgi:uncharacterized protein YegL
MAKVEFIKLVYFRGQRSLFLYLLAAFALSLSFLIGQVALANNGGTQIQKQYTKPLEGKVESTRIKSGMKVTIQELRRLAKREIVIIVDKSSSMMVADCPGKLSRWNWCAQELEDLTGRTTDVIKDGITVVVFSDDFYAYRNIKLDSVSLIFQQNYPLGTTATEKALASQLVEYISRRDANQKGVKPLLIAVITDGEPNRPRKLKEVIVDATKAMKYPEEIVISFLQVGHGWVGGKILNQLDDRLEQEGAAFDIVNYKSSDDVERAGLLGSLIAVISEHPLPYTEEEQSEMAVELELKQQEAAAAKKAQERAEIAKKGLPPTLSRLVDQLKSNQDCEKERLKLLLPQAVKIF